jgi:poly-gamma-glutamate synthesis protein (capsule biosynthesis protein)
MRNVKNYFEDSDLAIVNLEGTLTNASKHADKKFVFRGPPEFAKILSSSGIDAVTIANNHTYDYLQTGYADTVKNLEAEDIAFFGNEYKKVMEVNGIKVGLFGMNVLSNSGGYKDFVRDAVKELKDAGAQLIIAYYHWGIELAHYPHATQTAVGRFSIDEGCDLVLGSHPHVLQGIEE